MKNLFLVLVFGLVSLYGGSNISCEFVAKKECNAYTSKNKRTNPDNTKLKIGSSYEIIDLNVPKNATWYKLNVKDADPMQRWVYFDCGETSPIIDKKSNNNYSKKPSGDCSIPNQEDGYVFAVSWQPAFCEMMNNKGAKKPECKIDNPTAFQATNFTLHGLWPNKKSCGTNYGFCGKQQKLSGSFCKYPPLDLNTTVSAELNITMPSAGSGSCLQRHEWYKHGTCQERDENKYFLKAIDLLSQFNTGKIKKLVDSNIAQSVSKTDLFDAIDNTLGKDAHKRMKFMCYKDKSKNLTMLKDIYINLPKELTKGESLGALILSADETFSNSCGDSFYIDAIGQ